MRLPDLQPFKLQYSLVLSVSGDKNYKFRFAGNTDSQPLRLLLVSLALKSSVNSDLLTGNTFEKESYITLGTYKSEERCKEVISKIFENIKQNKYFYEMPEK